VPRFVCQLAVSVERTSVRKRSRPLRSAPGDSWLAETALVDGPDRFSMLELRSAVT
jgi:hypothetical protein